MKHIHVEVAPIDEIWREVSVLSHNQPIQERQYNFWVSGRVRRELRMRRTLKDVRVLVSLEEVFGRGLLQRFNNAQDAIEHRRST